MSNAAGSIEEKQKQQLKDALNQLTEVQFNEFLFGTDVPKESISSKKETRLQRVLDLLELANSPTGIGLSKIAQKLNQYILSKKLYNLGQDTFFKIVVNKLAPNKQLELGKKSLNEAIANLIQLAQSTKNQFTIKDIWNEIREEPPIIENTDNISENNKYSTNQNSTVKIENIIKEINSCKQGNLLILIGSGINLEDEINSQFIQEVKDEKKKLQMS